MDIPFTSYKHHNVKYIKCEYCAVIIFDRNLYNVHIDANHKCIDCGKLFRNRGTLVMHRSKQLHVNLIKCPLCCCSFRTKKHLNIHLKSHSDLHKSLEQEALLIEKIVQSLLDKYSYKSDTECEIEDDDTINLEGIDIENVLFDSL
jgi:hypothetical protein